MNKYALLVYKDTGIAGVGSAFVNEQIPTEEFLPPDKVLVEFDETHPDYELLYLLLVDDNIGTGSEYMPPIKGGVKYNFDTKRFEFTKEPPPNTLEIIRAMRNDMIRNTDDLMLVPDLPQALKDELIAYRQALRDVTANATNITPLDTIAWPTPPKFI